MEFNSKVEPFLLKIFYYYKLYKKTQVISLVNSRFHSLAETAMLHMPQLFPSAIQA